MNQYEKDNQILDIYFDMKSKVRNILIDIKYLKNQISDNERNISKILEVVEKIDLDLNKKT
jgi:hypothetical protein